MILQLLGTAYSERQIQPFFFLFWTQESFTEQQPPQSSESQAG